MKWPTIGDLVLVVFDDATSVKFETQWVGGDFVANHEPSSCDAVGWVVAGSTRFLTLSSLRDPAPTNPDNIGQVLAVPRGCVRKVTVLRKAR